MLHSLAADKQRAKAFFEQIEKNPGFREKMIGVPLERRERERERETEITSAREKRATSIGELNTD